MTLTAGTRLGPYTVQSALGAGGMGEVYLATDTRLNRNVALKILPDAFARDADRLARFQREAQVLASLNHPNIGAIHGLEETGDVKALVLELIEGPTLADRLAQGPMPLAEALPVALQIVDALEAAHEQGIVHRDLKPSNIKLRPDGTVKVLDFGLAKAADPARSGVDLTRSPTLMSPAATQLGFIIGTAAYMSPEQAKGKPADKRADIWAFGCVLFEMLAGTRAFAGDDVSDTMAAILRGDPEWTRLPADTPRAIVRLLKRCLEKDRRQRLHDIADARLDLQEALSAPAEDTAAPGAAPRRSLARRILPVAAAVILTAALTGLAAWMWRPEAIVQQTRFLVPLQPGEAYTATGRHVLALSPAGTHLVYVANLRLNVHALDQLETTALRGTDGIGDSAARAPFFSPDGRSIGFWQGGQMKRVGLEGGAAVSIVETPIPFFGASWTEDDVILFGKGTEGIWRVAASGGTPERIVEAQNGESAHGPQLLPDGEHLLFTVRPKGTSDWNDGQVVVQSLRTAERRVIVPRGRDGRYVPTGHLLYAQGGTLFAIRFDADRLEAIGGAASIVEGVDDAGGNSGAAHFAVSDNGSLVYVRDSVTFGRATPVWIDREGREQALLTREPIQGVAFPRLSPDGGRFSVIAAGDVWVYDLQGRPPIKLTSNGNLFSPLWSPDGRRLIYESSSPAALMAVAADGGGAAPEQVSPEGHFHPHGISADGTEIVAVMLDAGTAGNLTGADIVRLPAGVKSEPQPVVRTPNREGFEGASLSPDRRWLAYVSNATGLQEIWIQPYPGPGAPVRISPNGGIEPVWAGNGRELFYIEGRKMMAVTLDTRAGLSFAAPKQLFELDYAITSQPPSYDVAADGRFLMLKPADGQSMAAPIVVALNWFDELRRRLP